MGRQRQQEEEEGEWTTGVHVPLQATGLEGAELRLWPTAPVWPWSQPLGSTN